MIRSVILGIASCALLAACTTDTHSDAPVAQNFPLSYQKTLGGAEHWQAIAADSAGIIATVLTSHPNPVYVELPKNASAFDKAFVNLMKSSLIAKGLPIASKREGSAVLNCTNMPVEHVEGRVVRTHFGPLRPKATTPTAVPADTPNIEMVITCFVSEFDRYVATTQAVYYVPEGDEALYTNKSRTVGVVGQ